MAIVYPLTMPASPGFKESALLPRSAVGRAASPYSFATLVQDWGGQAWRFSGTLPPMPRALAELWRAFFLKLNGIQGTFLASPPACKSPRGAGGGTPLVAGAGQTGNELATDGWPAATAVLLAGDFIQLGTGASSRLHQVLDDVTSDGAGLATLLLWPKLRESPANDSAIVYTNPVGVWRLEEGIPPAEISTALHYGIGFAAEEVL